MAGSDQGESSAGRDRFGRGECSGVVRRLSGRECRLLSDVAELDIRRLSYSISTRCGLARARVSPDPFQREQHDVQQTDVERQRVGLR